MLKEKIAQLRDAELWLLRDDLPCSAFKENGDRCNEPTMVARVYLKPNNDYLVFPYCLAHLTKKEVEVLLSWTR